MSEKVQEIGKKNFQIFIFIKKYRWIHTMLSQKISEKFLAKGWKQCLNVCKRFKVENLFKKPILIKLFQWTQRNHSWQLWPKTFGKKPKIFLSLIANHKWQLILSFGKKASSSSKCFSEYVDFSFENAAGISTDERTEIFDSEKDENNVFFRRTQFSSGVSFWHVECIYDNLPKKFRMNANTFQSQSVSLDTENVFVTTRPKNFGKSANCFFSLSTKTMKLYNFLGKNFSWKCYSGYKEGSFDNPAEKKSRGRISCHHTHTL